MKRENRRDRQIERLRARLAELDAELEASGVEDALDWEKFPEMEQVMYALAERELERGWKTAAEVAERDETIELAELAEESCMSELAAFGDCQGWFFGSAEAPIVYETGFELWEDDGIEMLDEDWNVTEEWFAWDAASEDIPRFYEMNLSL